MIISLLYDICIITYNIIGDRRSKWGEKVLKYKKILLTFF